VLMLAGTVLFWTYRDKLPAASIPLVNYSLQNMASGSSLQMRLHRWRVSLDMIQAAPLTGLGIGTYYRLYPDFSAARPGTDKNRGAFYHGPENAHNYYIQLAADLGVPALLIFMLLVFCVCRAACSSIVATAQQQPLLAGLVAGISGYLTTCLTNHPLLLPVQQFLFWFAVAAAWLLCKPRGKAGLRLFSRGASMFLLAVSAAIIAGYLQYWSRPRHVGPYEYGLYSYQQGQQGLFRWTMKDAGMHTRAPSDLITVTLAANQDTVARNCVTVQLFIDDMLLDERHIIEPGVVPLAYCVPGMANREILVRISASATYNPYRLGISTDNRDLGVALAPIAFPQSLPEDGIGFYQKELWHDIKPAGWPPDKPLEFRWMSRQATLPVKEAARGKNLVLYLSAHHPDIKTAPVRVTIRGNGKTLQELVLVDSTWKKVEITPDQTMSATALTIRLSRTWNPRLDTGSRDLRDLGAMVAVAD
jgi:hypothetical protein